MHRQTLASTFAFIGYQRAMVKPGRLTAINPYIHVFVYTCPSCCCVCVCTCVCVCVCMCACACACVCAQMWNPADDPLLPEGGHFSVSKPDGKQVCKRELLQQLGLPYTDPWHSVGKRPVAARPCIDVPLTGPTIATGLGGSLSGGSQPLANLYKRNWGATAACACEPPSWQAGLSKPTTAPYCAALY
jgi:hypothetical protein